MSPEYLQNHTRRASLFGQTISYVSFQAWKPRAFNALFNIKYKVENSGSEPEAEKMEDLVIHWHGMVGISETQQSQNDHKDRCE